MQVHFTSVVGDPVSCVLHLKITEVAYWLEEKSLNIPSHLGGIGRTGIIPECMIDDVAQNQRIKLDNTETF